jgi:iron complex outermembrane recepter protein
MGGADPSSNNPPSGRWRDSPTSLWLGRVLFATVLGGAAAHSSAAEPAPHWSQAHPSVVKALEELGEVPFEPLDPEQVFTDEPILLPVQAEQLTRPRRAENVLPTDMPAPMAANPPAGRVTNTSGPAATRVEGKPGANGVASDAASLIERTPDSHAVATQRRNPIVRDPRVRGTRPGQLLASGSNYIPGRPDLDTPISKLDSDILERVNVVAGPYAARFGPGLTFLDVGFKPTPRYEDAPEFHGQTSLAFQSQGPQGAGRQSVWGGGEDWGVRLGYGYRAGDDYHDGQGNRIPSGYQSGVLDLAVGIDPTQDSRLEVNYFRLDQNDVEFSGQIFDIDSLRTDAVDIRYSMFEGDWYDLAEVNVWLNDTAFNGDAQNPDKRRQIPALNRPQYVGFTDVNLINTGYRGLLTWGETGAAKATVGTDLRFIRQDLDEISTFNTFTIGGVRRVTRNSPLPKSYSVDPGLFAETEVPLTDEVQLRFGGRAGIAATDIQELPLRNPGVPYTNQDLVNLFGTDETYRTFPLFALYATTEYKLTDQWTLEAGAGYAERTPTLIELYALDPFLGLLQQGFSAVRGSPNLAKEKNFQIDIGATWSDDQTLVRGRLFHAWVHDFVTFTPLGPQNLFVNNALLVQYVNTPLATLAGGEAYAERDIAPYATLFGVLAYVEGVNQDRDATGQGFVTRGQGAIEKEPLPGIVPLEGRVGCRFHPIENKTAWTIEPSVRLVAPQRRVAGSFLEQDTASFAVIDLRTTWKPRENWQVFAGIENLADTRYREHLDLRSGFGTIQPGINGYAGVTVGY